VRAVREFDPWRIARQSAYSTQWGRLVPRVFGPTGAARRRALRAAVRAFVQHYPEERPHQGLGNALIAPKTPHNGGLLAGVRIESASLPPTFQCRMSVQIAHPYSASSLQIERRSRFLLLLMALEALQYA
jgi:hypothetical protein